jgi:hypothetical protein
VFSQRHENECPVQARRWPILVAPFATRVGPLTFSQYLCHPDRSQATTLSSRPKRSEVEGPCVFQRRENERTCSSRRKAASFTSHSGGWPILVAPFATRVGPLTFPQYLCHPDRSEAKWRDLVFSIGAKTSVPVQAGATRHPSPAARYPYRHDWRFGITALPVQG